MDATVRDFLDAILSFIGTSSLTDDEYDSIDQTDLAISDYNLAAYTQLSNVLISRDAISTTTDRLRFFFLSKGVDVPVTDKANSNILIGAAL